MGADLHLNVEHAYLALPEHIFDRFDRGAVSLSTECSVLDEASLIDECLELVPRDKVVLFAVLLVGPRRSCRIYRCRPRRASDFLATRVKTKTNRHRTLQTYGGHNNRVSSGREFQRTRYREPELIGMLVKQFVEDGGFAGSTRTRYDDWSYGVCCDGCQLRACLLLFSSRGSYWYFPCLDIGRWWKSVGRRLVYCAEWARHEVVLEMLRDRTLVRNSSTTPGTPPIFHELGWRQNCSMQISPRAQGNDRRKTPGVSNPAWCRLSLYVCM